MGGGILIGINTAPAEWYASLQKPFFNPPNWIFGPIWTVLYMMIAVVGWRIWQRNHGVQLKRLWLTQICLNFLWSPAFFIAQMPGLSLCIITLLLLTIILFISKSWRQDFLSAILFIPYATWVGYASALNGAIFYLNT
jgi:tryptophan-rich sensory protein